MCPLNLADAALTQTAALPASTGSTSAIIDTENNAGTFVGVAAADNVALFEYELDVPALTESQLPNGDSITFVLDMDNTLAFNSSAHEVLNSNLLTVTGAGGDGSAAASVRFRTPVTSGRYIRVTATGSASGVAASGSNFTLTPKF